MTSRALSVKRATENRTKYTVHTHFFRSARMFIDQEIKRILELIDQQDPNKDASFRSILSKMGIVRPLEKITLYRNAVLMHALHTTHTCSGNKNSAPEWNPSPTAVLLLLIHGRAVGPSGKGRPGPPVLSLWAIKSWM